MTRFTKVILLLPLLLAVGCASIIDSWFERAFESTEERHVRHDSARLRAGTTLRHHRDASDLWHHQQRLRFQSFAEENDDD